MADLWLIISWLGASPLMAILYVAGTMGAGLLLIKFAKVGIGEAMRLLSSGDKVRGAAALFFAKLWLAGALLFFPGYLSDIVAVLILLFSLGGIGTASAERRRRGGGQAAPEIEAEAEVEAESADRRDERG